MQYRKGEESFVTTRIQNKTRQASLFSLPPPILTFHLHLHLHLHLAPAFRTCIPPPEANYCCRNGPGQTSLSGKSHAAKVADSVMGYLET